MSTPAEVQPETKLSIDRRIAQAAVPMDDAADRARSTTPFQDLDHAALSEILSSEGWKKQRVNWTAEGVGGQHIEWWNRGLDLIAVAVSREQALVLVPAYELLAAAAIARPAKEGA